MSISEKANDLLNKFCGAQYDYVVWSTQDNLVARDKARQELSAYIAELEEKQRWIPVSERLPEFGTSILFYDSILEKINKGTCTALNRDKTNLQWLTDDGIYYHGNRCEYITHWKEEPELPEVQE